MLEGEHHGREIALSELPSGTPLILTNSGNIAKLLNGEPSPNNLSFYLRREIKRMKRMREREREGGGEMRREGRKERARERVREKKTVPSALVFSLAFV